MTKRPFDTSENEGSRKDLEDGSPRLFLKKTPGGAGSHDEFDEMVPEFMHRDFYRSREDEFPAVDPNFQRRSTETQKAAPLTPLRGSQSEDVKPTPPKASAAPLTPLRSNDKEVESDTVSLEPEKTPIAPLRSEPAPFPRPVKTSSLNLPLVACLLFIVGLFLWREQTRPEVRETVELPVPKVIKVSEQTFEAAALQGESPYPDMAPVTELPEQTETNTEIQEASTSQAEVEDLEAQFSESRSQESAPEENSTTTYPATDASAQRAAILQRMNEGNVSRNERERRLEDGGARAESSSETSLFPDTGVDSATSPAQVEAATDELPEDAAVIPPDDSLFPVEAAPENTPPLTTPPPVTPPPVETPVTQGEPYQIAEPDL